MPISIIPVENAPIKKYFSEASLLFKLGLSLPVKIYNGIDMISIPRNNISNVLNEEDMEYQVQSEANQYIPFSLDEVNLDFQVIGPTPNSEEEVEVLIAASRKEKIEDRVVF